MAYKPAKWPTYALESLEDVLALLQEIESEAAQAQRHAREGDRLNAVIVLSDIRTKAMLGHSALIQGKAGEYKRNPA